MLVGVGRLSCLHAPLSLAKTLLRLAQHKRRDLIEAHLKGIQDGFRDAFFK